MKYGSPKSITVNSTSAKFVGAAPNRTALTISPPATGNITLTTDATAVQFSGLIINQGQALITLDENKIGSLVKSEWNAIADADGRLVGVIEVLETP